MLGWRIRLSITRFNEGFRRKRELKKGDYDCAYLFFFRCAAKTIYESTKMNFNESGTKSGLLINDNF